MKQILIWTALNFGLIIFFFGNWKNVKSLSFLGNPNWEFKKVTYTDSFFVCVISIAFVVSKWGPKTNLNYIKHNDFGVNFILIHISIRFNTNAYFLIRTQVTLCDLWFQTRNIEWWFFDSVISYFFDARTVYWIRDT